MGKVIWAEPRNITSISDCYFYHTMDIPKHGTVHGEWDLRGRERAYLGNLSFQGKSVLDIGTASGHLCFTMEKMGAEVVAYDLSDEQEWDIVPYAGYDYEKQISQRKEHIRRINNGFWIAHRAYNSHAKMTYGTVYKIPDDIGQFDICTLGSILLHLRDPFLALQRISVHAREAIVVTDVVPVLTDNRILAGSRLIEFLPNAYKCSPIDTWFRLTPELISEFLQILGFIHTEISFHQQICRGKEVHHYTVIGRRKGATVARRDSHEEESDSALSGGKGRSVLEEVTLQNISFFRIAKHLLRRGIRAIHRRMLTRN